jgi:large subunit ribosomal protein L15
MLSLHTIKPKPGSKKRKKRIGRGIGSGSGKTSGRGMKGQKSRSGASGFQRLGMRKLMLATPKLRGFTSPHASASVVNLSALSEMFAAGDIVTPKILKQKKLVAKISDGVKILGDGDISIALTVRGCKVSASAEKKITAAGGTIKA